MATLIQEKSKGALRQQTTLDTFAQWVTPVAAAAMFIALWFIGPELNRSDLRIMTFIFMWVGLTSSWNLIGGYTGYTDFGHSVFVGVGGYIAGILMARLGILTLGDAASVVEQREVLWSFGQAIPFVFIGGAVFAGLIGYPTLRLKGPYFSIAMLGVLVAMREIARNNPFGLTNGGKGLSFYAPFAAPDFIYHVMLILVGVIFFTSLWMYRVQVGKMLKAIRDDEVGADMRGINTVRMKVGIFMLAGGFTATIGATKAYWDGFIDPDTIFPETYHIEIIMMVMLGGIGRPWGPVVGALVFYYGKTLIWANAGQQHLIITGLMLIAIMLFMPGGILSLFDPEDRGLAWLIRRYVLGQKDQVFDDDSNFAFQEIPTEARALASQTEKDRLHTAAQDKPIVLQGQGVTKDFGGLRAVNCVDFEIRQGEIVGLLGPNGSGKTTLFNCLSGVLKPTEGKIEVDGQDVTGLPPWQVNRAGLARTFQRLRVYKKQTVYDNMLLARKWKGVPAWLWLLTAPKEIRDKADDLVVFLKIDHVATNFASNLSGGQQRLLEMGMTLMSDPAVVLLDEATSGVNPALVEEIKDSIRRLNSERGITFFLVEHNMNFAMELCSRLYVLDYGTKITEGTPEDIQNNEQVIEAYFGRDR
jgi:ABC-type branched-subunit amino acid transport system ATPase component/ABC-type branched-subunit amino acid transport system permease subunit